MFMAMVVAEFDLLCLFSSGESKRNPKEAGLLSESMKQESGHGGGGATQASSYLTGLLQQQCIMI
jgi:hypothetical protein